MDRERDKIVVGVSVTSLEMESQASISSVISFSKEENRALKSLSIEACESEIKKPIESTRNPRKDLLVADMFGQLALLYQRKSKLEIELSKAWREN